MNEPLTFFQAARALAVNLIEGWTWKSVLSAIFLTLFGPITPIHQAFVILVVLDLITGIMAARKAGVYASHIGKVKSVIKISGYAVALILAAQLEAAMSATPYKVGAPYTVGAFLLYLVITEARSVVENLRKLGVQINLFGNPTKELEALKEDFSGKPKDDQSNKPGS